MAEKQAFTDAVLAIKATPSPWDGSLSIYDHMWPFSEIGMTVTPAMMLDSRSIGYVYDTDQG